MAMGKRDRRRQGRLWIEAERLAEGPAHPFYRRLNKVIDGEGFDDFVETVCERFYAETMGRPSMPPAVYFRLLLVGYFEGIDSERGIAWRVADSLSLREFLGYELTDATPDHSTISRTRRLIDLEAHQDVFAWVLRGGCVRLHDSAIERPDSGCDGRRGGVDHHAEGAALEAEFPR